MKEANTMPQTITVNIPHRLGKAEAKRRIEEGFNVPQATQSASLLGLVSFQKQWEGDRMDFEARALTQKIAASLEVGDESVQVRIQVPDLIAAFADAIKKGVMKETTKALEHQK
jgi:hypothetical protein